MGPNWDLVAWLIAGLFVLLAAKRVEQVLIFRRWERACEEAHKAQADFVNEMCLSGWDHPTTGARLTAAIGKWESLCRIRKLLVHEEHVQYLKNLQADFEQARTS